jgi:uncharacterized membrane protein YwaF
MMTWGTFTPVHFVTLTAAAAILTGMYFALKKAPCWVQTAVLGVLSFSGIAAIIYNLVVWDAPLEYLPLHLCSINIFVIAFHAIKPTKTVGNYLYTVCIPGAMAALLFPTWNALPGANYMLIHSFTVHILLALYPIVLTVACEIKPELKELPKALLLLTGLAALALICNLLMNANFMFLMYAEPGNPLYLFKEMWGSHLWGFPVIMAGVLLVMYFPHIVLLIKNKIKSKNPTHLSTEDKAK